MTYKWSDEVTRKNAVFVWRQADGDLRWDFFGSGVQPLTGGSFTIEPSVDSGGTLFAEHAYSCRWFVPADMPRAVTFCGSGADSGALVSHLNFLDLYPVTGVLKQQDIADHRADCYSLDTPTETSILCVELATKTPLSFVAVKSDGAVVSIEAIAVGVASRSGDFTPADPLPIDVSLKDAPAWDLRALRLPRSVTAN